MRIRGNMKKKIALIFGGRSVERDISVITAFETKRALDNGKYDILPVFLFEGDFYTGDMNSIKDFAPFLPSANYKLVLLGGVFYLLKKGKLTPFFKPDVVVNCCHGGEGEDGTVAGLLEYNGLPHTSPDLFQSALCMDKVESKVFFDNMFLNTAKSVWFTRDEYVEKMDQVFEKVESRIEYPMIVKPSHSGSSIGISVAHNLEQLKSAIDIAIEFDDKVLVEHKLTDFVEVNCAVYKGSNGVVVSSTEQPLSKSDFLSFEDKYVAGKMSGGGHVIPAPIGNLNRQIEELTERLYTQLGLKGVVRIDYLVDTEREKVYINEINTVPGSLAHYLFEKKGVSFEEMLDDIIEHVEAEHLDKKSRVRNFSTGVLDNFKGGVKSPKLKG